MMRDQRFNLANCRGVVCIFLMALLSGAWCDVRDSENHDPQMVSSALTNELGNNKPDWSTLKGVVVLHRHAIRTPRVLASDGRTIHSSNARLVPEGKTQMHHLGEYLYRHYFDSDVTNSEHISARSPELNSTATADTVPVAVKNYYAAFSAMSPRCIESSHALWEGFHNVTKPIDSKESDTTSESELIYKKSGPDYMYQLNTWANFRLHLSNPEFSKVFSLKAFTESRMNTDIKDVLTTQMKDIAREAQCGSGYDEYFCILVAYDVASILHARGQCDKGNKEDLGDARETSVHTTQPVGHGMDQKNSIALETSKVSEWKSTPTETSPYANSTKIEHEQQTLTSPTLCSPTIYEALREVSAYQNYHYYAFFTPDEFQKDYVGSFTLPLFGEIQKKVAELSHERSADPPERRGTFLIDYSVHDGTLVGLYTMLGVIREETPDVPFRSVPFELPEFGEALILEFYENNDVGAFRLLPTDAKDGYHYGSLRKHLPLRCLGKTKNHKMINVNVTRSSSETKYCKQDEIVRYVKHHWTPTKVHAEDDLDHLACHPDPADLEAAQCRPDDSSVFPKVHSTCAYYRQTCPDTACTRTNFKLDTTTLQCIPIHRKGTRSVKDKKISRAKRSNVGKLSSIHYDSHDMHRLVASITLVSIVIVSLLTIGRLLRGKKKGLVSNGKPSSGSQFHGPPTYSTF